MAIVFLVLVGQSQQATLWRLTGRSGCETLPAHACALDWKEPLMTEPGDGLDSKVPGVLADMTAVSLAAADLDPATLMMVRLAALVAVGAPPLSYVLNLDTAEAVGVTKEQAEAVLVAVAPIVGTARIVAAASGLVEGMGLKVAFGQGDVPATL
jgi:alkylhydroperoxidase/carboxymuconolactone decarboxylase family protein YurZ